MSLVAYLIALRAAVQRGAFGFDAEVGIGIADFTLAACSGRTGFDTAAVAIA